MYSKKFKLPKKYWVKGKSKFLDTRLEEENAKIHKENLVKIAVGNNDLTPLKKSINDL